MAPKKTATLNLRIDPLVKEGIKLAAAKDQRSVANLVELLIRKHCKEIGISVPEQTDMFGDSDG